MDYKKLFIIFLVIVIISCKKDDDKITGVYAFDIETYLSQEKISKNLELLGLGNIDIKKIADVDNWEKYEFYKIINEYKNPQIKNYFDEMRMDYWVFKNVEISIYQDKMVLKQFNRHMNKIIINIMRYDIIEENENSISVCIYNKKNELIGTRIIEKEGERITLINQADRLYFKKTGEVL